METLNDFIEKKVNALRQPGATMLDLNNVEYMPISVKQFKDALRDCAEKTVEAVRNPVKSDELVQAWLGPDIETATDHAMKDLNQTLKKLGEQPEKGAGDSLLNTSSTTIP